LSSYNYVYLIHSLSQFRLSLRERTLGPSTEAKMQTKLALVLGANGGSGSEIAKALMAHGWRVRALVRTLKPGVLPGAEIVTGDAMRRADVVAAAAGASLIVHAVNPPAYRN